MKVFVSFVLLIAVAVAEPPRFRNFQQQRQYYFARQQEETTTANAPYPASGWRPAGPAFNLPQRQAQSSPQQQYGAPQQQYGAPQQQYGTPQQQYGAPQQQYPSAPEQQYGASNGPQQQYGAPQQQYPSAPEQQYGASNGPQQQYGAPEQQYGAPQQEYGAAQEATTTEAPNSTEFDEPTTVSSATEAESEPVNSVNELDDEDVDEQQPQQTGEYYIALPDGRLQRVRYVSRQDVEAMKYYAKIRAENVEPLRGPIYAYAPLQKLQIVPGALQLAVSPLGPVAAAPVQPSKPEKLNAAPAKLEIEPVAAQVQYQYDNPAPVIPLGGSPLSSSYTTYTANYQAPNDNRYIVALQ